MSKMPCLFVAVDEISFLLEDDKRNCKGNFGGKAGWRGEWRDDPQLSRLLGGLGRGDSDKNGMVGWSQWSSVSLLVLD